ncbi:hypothetical protein [Paenibacillus sp. MMO-177]
MEQKDNRLDAVALILIDSLTNQYLADATLLGLPVNIILLLLILGYNRR